MADSFSMKLEGAEALDKALRQLEPKIAKKHLVRSLRVGAKLILAATKAAAPVKTGRLKRSLTVRTGKTKRARHEKIINVQPSSKKEPGLITYSEKGRRSFYPAVVEYGTAKRAAKPFMRPAFDAQKRPAVNAIMKTLRDAVEMEARKK